MPNKKRSASKRVKKRVKKIPYPQVELVEWFDDHYYHVMLNKKEDYWLTSVTTHLGIIDKPHLQKWYGDLGWREANRRLNEYADAGSRIHFACSQWVANNALVIYNPPPNKKQNYTPQEMRKLHKKFKERLVVLERQEDFVQVWNFQKMFERLNPLVLGIEQVSYSLVHRYAGMLDYLIEATEKSKILVNGQLVPLRPGVWVMDLKSGSDQKEHRMQLAAYVKSESEKSGIAINGAIIVYLDPGRKGSEEAKIEILEADAIENEFRNYIHAKSLWEAYHPSAKPTIFNFPRMLGKPEVVKEALKIRKAA